VRSPASTPAELAEFQSGLRRRYSDEEILEELRACSARLGRSPTMKEFADDPETRVHPQTVIEHFGSWNKAKAASGARPPAERHARGADRPAAGARQAARPCPDCEGRRDETAAGCRRSRSTGTTFGSLTNALREAGFDVPVGEERLERAIEQGVAMARRSDGCRSSTTGRGEAQRSGAADGVAGVPHVRSPAWGVVDVPVPRSPKACGTREWRSAATGA
jgi:hypothetical protein